MKRTFLVKLELGTEDPLQVSELLFETLLDEGLPVISVEPWTDHSDTEDPSELGLGIGSIPGAPAAGFLPPPLSPNL